ncbi:iron-hydroxamate ABC transporter substrate-binding protein [Radiobacillus deserti]|uniref:Iron-hydroxamate ABC transporter substrate-binding protein n=1 Tax=Radiobacillus deserti TaxID=2594883 RepID=A0A516KI61_9BACI|nr:iron-hydroxamate ABC transporter substrate-binding protein [Radiobacillus deserti]QDP41085.1 iron-hydroxamate ABC transporter substrate-binding protein [Radiobacillus deserti]
MKKQKYLYMLATLFAFLFLVACGNGNETDDNASDTEKEKEQMETEEAAKERTLTDAMGHEVTIPAEPKRVIASYLEDYLVALGITPVAQWSVQDGASIQDYLQDSLKDVPTIPHDLPYETVASFEPDLIILDSASMAEGNKYDQYNSIAPTYVIGEAQNNAWREEFKEIGKVFGMEEKAQEVLDDYEKKAADAKEEINAAIGDESVAAIWLVANTFYVVSENLSSGDVLYNDLGLAVPDVVKEISESSEQNWSEISLEKLAELDADHIFLINSDKANGSTALEDEIWQNIPAVKNGNIYEYDPTSSWLYTGPVANSKMLDYALESLTK